MKIQTDIAHSGLYLLLIISSLIGILYLVYFLRHAKKEYPLIQRRILASIRFAYAFFLTFLLLSPLLEFFETRIEKPILVIGVDNSQSISKSTDQQEIVDLLDELRSKLGEKIRLESFAFGNEVEKTDRFDFNELRSNYASFLKETEKRFFNQNVGGVLLIGDGIFNDGINPEQEVQNFNHLLYTVGMGDTLVNPDQQIINVNHNPNVFIQNSFPLEVELNFIDYPNKNALLSVSIDGKTVKSEEIEIPQENYFVLKEYQLNAEKIGISKVQVSLSPFSDEKNTLNNYFSFPIEVHDNRKNILILSEGPHPDIGAISETLKKQANFNIDVGQIGLFEGNPDDYDLLLLNQLPSLKTQNDDFYEKIKSSTTPLLLIVGPKTSLSALNNLNLDFFIKPTLLTEESSAYFNESFSTFTLPVNIREIEKIYPPLLTFYTDSLSGFTENYSTLAFQKIKGIELVYPLITLGEVKNRKVGLIMGEGIWRWKLREYQYFNSQNGFNQLLVNLFNYLTLDENLDQLKVTYEKIVSETSPVIIQAQLYNEIFEAVNSQEVALTLRDSTGSELSYIFDRNRSAYSLNLGYLDAGTYSFEVSTELAGTVLQEEGSFTVSEVNIEQLNMHADFGLLRKMASQTGGKFFGLDKKDEILEELQQSNSFKVKSHRDKTIQELINWRLYAIIIIILFSTEWFLRKFWGLY